MSHDAPPHLRSRWFDEWCEDEHLQKRMTFGEYVEMRNDERMADDLEYERVEEAALRDPER